MHNVHAQMIDHTHFQYLTMANNNTKAENNGSFIRNHEIIAYALSEQNVGSLPSLPIVRGKGTYAADQGNVVQSVAEDACRKASYGHPILTPGTFKIANYWTWRGGVPCIPHHWICPCLV